MLMSKAMVLGVVILLISCNSSATVYDKLCKIYEEIVTKDITLIEKEDELIDKIHRDLRQFFDDNYYHITLAKPHHRYQLIKQLAEMETEKPWDCEVMKSYYENQFNSSE